MINILQDSYIDWLEENDLLENLFCFVKEQSFKQSNVNHTIEINEKVLDWLEEQIDDLGMLNTLDVKMEERE